MAGVVKERTGEMRNSGWRDQPVFRHVLDLCSRSSPVLDIPVTITGINAGNTRLSSLTVNQNLSLSGASEWDSVSCAPWVRPVRYEYWPQGVLFLPRRARRVLAPACKAEVVRELLTGKRSAAELCREHQLSPCLLALWKDTALEHRTILFQGDEPRDPEQARIAELERLAGRQARELESLTKASRLLPGTAARSGRSSGSCATSTPPASSARCWTARAPGGIARRPRCRRTRPTCVRPCSGWLGSGPPTVSGA